MACDASSGIGKWWSRDFTPGLSPTVNHLIKLCGLLSFVVVCYKL